MNCYPIWRKRHSSHSRHGIESVCARLFVFFVVSDALRSAKGTILSLISFTKADTPNEGCPAGSDESSDEMVKVGRHHTPSLSLDLSDERCAMPRLS